MDGMPGTEKKSGRVTGSAKILPYVFIRRTLIYNQKTGAIFFMNSLLRFSVGWIVFPCEVILFVGRDSGSHVFTIWHNRNSRGEFVLKGSKSPVGIQYL